MRRLFFFLLFLFLNVAQILSANDFVRTDFRDETIYFLMTTRFYDGDLSNNVQCWDGTQYNQGDPAWRGDFKGIIEKLDYIKALGFTAIWITPVVENCSGYDYHGYHAINFDRVDPRYESQDVDFQTLVDAVHAHDMKIILDVVFNHTGNFGEENLCPMFNKEGDLSSVDCLQLHPDNNLPDNYADLSAGEQYQARLARMKNTDGTNHDVHNYWHHFGNFNWDDITSQWAQIAGDCVDLNTENPAVYNYLVRCYTKFIKMGVDGFRIDTGKHINRLVFNEVFNQAFHDAANRNGNSNFFMFSEICTRFSTYWYRDTPSLSTPFYTWKDTKEYAWSSDSAVWNDIRIMNGTEGFTQMINQKSCVANYNDNSSVSNQPRSTNAFLQGNDYHTPDYSQHSGLNVIDFPMHWNFKTAAGAYQVARDGDHAYNDATFNVTYIDSHDYAPDHAPENQRFAQPQNVWAENLSLIYTFRGIPCLYYGSEIEFKKGCTIDKGPNMPLRESGRAYFGDYITGDIKVNDFADYEQATGNIAVTLKHPLALHIQRLSQIRMAVPALRKGQYSTSGCSGNFAFKRRYTDATTDSYALVTISGNATFTNVPNGNYIDCITGEKKIVNSGTLTANCSGKGNVRVYVLTTAQTSAPGKVGEHGKFLYDDAPHSVAQGTYPDPTEVLLEGEGSGETPDDDEEIITPCVNDHEQAVFFERSSAFTKNVNVYIWHTGTGKTVEVCGAWPGKKMTAIGNKIYKYVLPESVGNIDETWNVIFNSSVQTKDLKLINNGYYTGSNNNDVSCTEIVTLDCSEIPETSSENIYTSENTIYTHLGSIYINTHISQTIHIYTTDGKMLRSVKLQMGENTISDLKSGLYLVIFADGSVQRALLN